MNDYLATFHTHLSAMLTCQALTGRGVSARMTPVPRRLSSSCGTCVRFTAAADCRDCLDRDAEALYRADGDDYTLLLRNE